ncbi:hypothetical protein ACH5RR_017842 [Cinchona calisaya]|uniref:Uncharacterized protein n=1 Tax=Cinchona calisaya TaxID=153742 RepID=A0ABD2ZPQ1_9GENT
MMKIALLLTMQALHKKSWAKQFIFENYDTTSFRGDSFSTETSKTAASMDDSFMVQSSPEVDDHHDSQWKTDISTVVDWNLAENENGDANVADTNLEISRINEPVDLFVMLVWDDQSEPTGTSWTPEMDYGMEPCMTQFDKKPEASEPNSRIENKLPEKGKSTNTKINAGSTLRASIKDARFKVLQGKSKKTHTASRCRSVSSFFFPFLIYIYIAGRRG